MTLTPHTIDALRDHLPEAAVTTPGGPDYDSARQMFGGGVDNRPGVIVRVTSAEDVATVVQAARESGSELAIRGGGHAANGFSTTRGGILLDTTGLDSFDLDEATRTVWAGAGLTAAAYTALAGEHGLATGFGDTGSVGIAGITLGGGVGFLSRKLGLTVDSLLAAELVTADGELIVTDESRHPDLFWALRGGGGGFGVVTRLHLQLHDVPQIYGGMLMLPATAEIVSGAVRASLDAPTELTTIINVMPCPPLPFAPTEVHGSLVAMILLAYAGDAPQGEAAVAPLRALATPLADFLQPMPYSGLFQPEDPDYHPVAVGRNLFVNHVDEEVAATTLRWLTESDASLRVAQFRPLGAAVADVPSDATAYAHRRNPVMVNVANFVNSPAERETRDQWAADFADALDQGLPGMYVNFVGSEGDAGGRVAYPEPTRARLREVKTQYDPDNLFSRCYPLEDRAVEPA